MHRLKRSLLADLAIHRLRGPPTELKLPASSLTGRYEVRTGGLKLSVSAV